MNPANIQDLLIQSIKLLSSGESRDTYEERGRRSDEEDEGEIVSDDEEMQVDSKKPTMAIRYGHVTIWYGHVTIWYGHVTIMYSHMI